MEQNRKPDVDQMTELLEAHKFKQLKLMKKEKEQ